MKMLKKKKMFDGDIYNFTVEWESLEYFCFRGSTPPIEWSSVRQKARSLILSSFALSKSDV